MKLKGHRVITKKAVNEFLAEYKRGSTTDLRSQLFHKQATPHGVVVEEGPDHYAVQRDLIDVITTGHWSNFAQKHHFMRQFDGQSPYQAYTAGCKWINSNALDWASAAAAGKGSSKLQKLGNACHAVEDSFAKGHAEREKAASDNSPGAIKHVKLYAGKEKENHAHHDKTWEASGGGLSFEGRLAKNAVKSLLFVIFDAVFDALDAGHSRVASLSGWSAYRNKWFKASPKLSKQRDEVYDLVDQFYSGVVWGDTQHATDFDEKGLAEAIYNKLGVDTNKIHDVFHRLNEYHTADADDVALIYVNILRKEKTPRVSKALSQDSRARKLIIKVMDEGWTTDEEKKCIQFLENLRK